MFKLCSYNYAYTNYGIILYNHAYIYIYQTLYPPRNWHIPPWENENHRLKSAGDCRGIWDSSREKKKSRMTYAPPCCHPARSFPEIKMPTVIVIQLPMSAWSGIKGILSQQKANNKAWTKQASKNRILSWVFFLRCLDFTPNKQTSAPRSVKQKLTLFDKTELTKDFMAPLVCNLSPSPTRYVGPWIKFLTWCQLQFT